MIDLRQHPLLDHVIQRLEGQVGVDGIDTVAQQHGKVMHLTGFARFQDQRNPGTGSGPDQVVVQAGSGQKRRDGGKLIVHPTVRQNQDGATGLDEADRSTEQAVKRLLHPFGAIRSLEQQRKGGSLEAGTIQTAQLLEILVGQDRMLQLDHPRIQCGRLEQVGLGTD